MTFDRMLEGLQALVFRLGNRQDTIEPPPGWKDFEWAYVQGIASHAILTLIDTLGRRHADQ